MKKIIIALILVLNFIFSFFNSSFAYEFNIANVENLEEYKNEIGKKIQDNWRLTKEEKTLEAIIKAKVDKNGKYDNEIEIIKSSGSIEFDEKVKKAFLASIDKNDELLRFYPEFTFKNGTIYLTQNGLKPTELMAYKEKLLGSSEEIRSVITLKDRNLFKNKNAYIIFKTNKKGDILDSKIVNAQDKLLLKLENAKNSINKLPEARNLSTDKFWVIVVYTKFSSIPYIYVETSEKDVQKTLTEEEWKTYCFRTIENMWKADDTDIQCTLPATMIISKDGYIKEYSFQRKKLNVASFIMEKIKLPPLAADEAFSEYIEGINFESAANTGKYITLGAGYILSRQVAWGDYMREVETRIKTNWKPNKDNRSKRVVIGFIIQKDGSLKEDVRIVVSSGSKTADDSAIEAVQKTAPFKPLPEEFEGDSVPIEFTFDYNVINNLLNNTKR